MFLGTLLLLTVLTSAQTWGWSWPSVEDGGLDDGVMMRIFGRLQEAMIPNQNTNNTIIKDAILRTLRSPAQLTNPTMDKRDSNGETVNHLRLQSILRALKKINSPTRNRDISSRIRIL